MPELKEKYKKEIIPELKKELGFKNSLQCPKIDKIVINVGTGRWVTKESSQKKEILDNIFSDLSAITGQKPQIRKAKKSIAGFSVKEGMPIGVKVTLRGKRMYQFLDRIINIVFPRIRDFKGVKKSSVDKKGNLTIGIKEQLVFPEISPDDTDFMFGMEITIATSANNKEEGIILLEKMGVLFEKEEKK